MLAAPAAAAEFRDFNSRAFADAQRAGKPILVDVAASWCPICKAQAPIIEKYSAEPKFKSLIIYHLDFDTQKAEWRKFGVHMQSTLIAFHGEKETARTVGESDPKSIARVLDATDQ